MMWCGHNGMKSSTRLVQEWTWIAISLPSTNIRVFTPALVTVVVLCGKRDCYVMTWHEMMQTMHGEQEYKGPVHTRACRRYGGVTLG
mmetsp:Transcript_22807/g.63632  ORF Transcript_22807/g.63632 Transcript_22807/m.63632 type:complete len:87 (-) Transcript_22807:256-516(-)